MRSLRDALALEAETDDVEFVASFDPSSAKDWCELLRDVVAMANSGGGIVVLGLESGGAPSGALSATAMDLDAATIQDHVLEYAGSHLAGVRAIKERKEGRPVLALEIEADPCPLVFVERGEYEDGGATKVCFEAGTVWFRRSARSELGTVDDVRRAFDREIERRMDGWLESIRRVLAAPAGSVVSVTTPGALAAPGERGLAVRLVSDPHAPAVPRWSPDDTHPHRMKDVVAIVNSRAEGRPPINGFDLLCVRRAWETDREPTWFYKSKIGTPQYSDAFVEWLVDHYIRDPGFFADARARAPRWRAKSA